MKRPAPIIPAQISAGDIYAMVQCLSHSEKNLVRKIWGRNSVRKVPLHITLFEAIAEGKAVNDATAQVVTGLSGGAQFSNLKQHLHNEVLDALVIGLRDQLPETQLHFGLMQLQLLIERSHTVLARRLCKKLWTLADEAGLYGFALELLYQKGRLIEQRSFRQYTSEADEIAMLIDRYTHYQHTGQRIQRFTDRLSLLRSADQLLVTNEHREAIQFIMNNLLGLSTDAESTPHLKLRYLAAISTAAYMNQHFELCNAWTEEALQLLEERPVLVSSDPESFLSVANTSFYNQFAQSNISGVSNWLSRFNTLALITEGSEYFRKRWAIIRFNTTLKIAHKTGNFEQVEQIVDEEGTQIISFATQVLPAADSLSVITSILISFFVLERYSESEDLMLEIKERNRNLDRQDVFYFTLVFYLVILYEQKDWYRLDSATEAAYHVLYARKKLRPFEKELMRFLKVLPTRRGRGDTKEFIRAFMDRLEVYRTDPIQRLYFLYFNYYDWLQSKLEGVSYRDYKRQLLRQLRLEAV
jgi:hypothetical protein